MPGTEVGRVFIKLVADGDGLADSIDSELGKAEGKASGKVGAFFTKLAAGGAVAVAAGAAKAVFDFTSFERSMNEVFTLLPGISYKAMDEMTGQVKDFAKEFGVLPDKVVPALYQSLSAGVPADNVFAFLETAQKAAKGGVTELSTAVDGISSVVNAYGADVVSATQASDMMFTAVKLGKTNFNDLSASLFNVTPTAAALGVQFGDVTAALAAMTLQGVPTSVATTQLRQLFVELSKAGSATSDTFKEIAGVGFKDFIAGGGNVQSALQLLEQHAKDSGLGINDLFGSVEAGSAALALTGGGTQKFSDALTGMAKSAGATDTAFHTMNKGLGPLIDKVKAFAAVWLIDVGGKIASVIEAIGYGFMEMDVTSDGFFGTMERVGVALRKALSAVVDAWPKVQAVLMAVVAVVVDNLPAILVIGRNVFEGIVSAVQTAAAILKPILLALFAGFTVAAPIALGLVGSLSGAFRVLTGAMDSPVFKVIAGIITVTLIPAIVRLAVVSATTGARTVFWWGVMQAQAIKTTAVTVAQFVIQGARWAWLGVQSMLHAAKVAAAWVIAMGPIAIVVAAVVAAVVLIVKNWDTIVSAVSGAAKAVGRFLANLVGHVVDFVQEWGVLLLGPIGLIWKFRDQIWDAIQAVIGFFGRLAAGAAEKLVDLVVWVAGIPGRIHDALGDLGSWLWDKGTELLTGLWNGAKDVAGKVASWLGGRAVAFFAAVGDVARTLWDKGSALLGGLWEGAKDVAGKVGSWLAERPGVFVDNVGDIARLLWDKGSAFLTGLWDGAKEIAGKVGSWLAERPGVFVDNVGDVARTLWTKGTDLVGGILGGLWEKWIDVAAWIRGIPGEVVEVLGDLGSLLVDAGKAVINGLWEGMKSAWRNVSGWVGGLAGKIASLKGPLDYDRTLLTPAGQAIMQGLVAGLRSEEGRLVKQLARITGTISNLGMPGFKVGALNLASPSLGLPDIPVLGLGEDTTLAALNSRPELMAPPLADIDALLSALTGPSEVLKVGALNLASPSLGLPDIPVLGLGEDTTLAALNSRPELMAPPLADIDALLSALTGPSEVLAGVGARGDIKIEMNQVGDTDPLHLAREMAWRLS